MLHGPRQGEEPLAPQPRQRAGEHPRPALGSEREVPERAQLRVALGVGDQEIRGEIEARNSGRPALIPPPGDEARQGGEAGPRPRAAPDQHQQHREHERHLGAREPRRPQGEPRATRRGSRTGCQLEREHEQQTSHTERWIVIHRLERERGQGQEQDRRGTDRRDESALAQTVERHGGEAGGQGPDPGHVIERRGAERRDQRGEEEREERAVDQERHGQRGVAERPERGRDHAGAEARAGEQVARRHAVFPGVVEGCGDAGAQHNQIQQPVARDEDHDPDPPGPVAGGASGHHRAAIWHVGDRGSTLVERGDGSKRTASGS